MTNELIAKASQYVRHAALQPANEPDGDLPATAQWELELAGVYVQTNFGYIHTLASNGISTTHCNMRTEECSAAKDIFIPIAEEASENKENYELLLEFFYNMNNTLTDIITITKEGLLYLMGNSAFKVVSFDEVISVKIPVKEIINFCNALPSGAKIQLSVQSAWQIDNDLLYLFCQLSDTLYIEQLTISCD